MIIVHESKSQSTYHTFEITQGVMQVVISPGEYVRNDEVLLQDSGQTVIEIETPVQDTQYNIYLEQGGVLLTEDIAYVPSTIDTSHCIDRLAWFVVPAGATALDTVEINVIKVVQIDAD